MPKARGDVDEATAIGVDPEGDEREPDMVGRDRCHRRPLEVDRLLLVDPGVMGRDRGIAVEHAALVVEQTGSL